MASVTVDSAAAATSAGGTALRMDSIPIVDLRLLSQSELYSLSRCSSSSFDSSRRDEVVIPILDRSVFNESAGSRKQTYSRVRLAPSSAAPHRRTPHIRSTFGSLNDKSDPENVENAQIINLLKQIFVADMKAEDLVPVRIEYSNSIPMQQFSSPAPSSPPNVGIIGQKRKRGRPRKENASELISGLGFVEVDVGVSDADGGFPLLNDFFVRENGEEKDREVLNRDGVAVDLVALGAVEHPFWEEIRRRTEGLQTEVEFLEFLGGLDGQWGSRRKKKRIVDANEFGTVLPVGWKLSLSVKKKNGHVWLYCRRYISPSGLHFVSCKGVSSYLLSLHGVQDTNLPGFVPYDEMVIDDDKLTSVPLAHLPIVEVNKTENIISHASSSPALGHTTGDHERQVPINAGNLPEGTMGEILNSSKSIINFSEKDELLPHHSSLQKRTRHKNGTRITDGVIIKDGMYECQFCHKTFTERHRYNGHVGTHVRYQAKTAAESSETVTPNSLNKVPIQDISMEGSLKSDNAVEISNSITNNQLHTCSPSPNNNEHIGELPGAVGNMRGIDESTDLVPKTDPCSILENKSFLEDAHPNGSGAEMFEDGSSLQDRRSNSSLPLDDATHGVTNDGGIEKSDQIMASESCLLDSNAHEEERVVVNNSEHIDQTSNQHNLDCKKFAVDGSVLDSLGSEGDRDIDFAFHVKEKSDLESLPCNKTGTTDVSILDIAHDEKALVEDNNPCTIQKGKLEDALTVDDYENESSKADNDGVNSLVHYGISSAFPSWDEQETASKKGNGSMYYESNNGVCRKKTEVSEFDAFQNFGNRDSSDPFSSSHAVINSNSITGTDQGNKIGGCSPFTSASDKQLFTEDNMIRMFNGTLEEHRQEPSGGMILGQSGVSDVSNKIENTGKHELSLSFGNLQTDMCTGSNRVEPERYQANSFSIDSFVHKTYEDPPNMSVVSSNIPAELKQDRLFGIEFPNLPFDNRAHDLGSSFNMAHPGRDNLGTPGQNFMVGFGNSLQSGGCGGADGSWRSGHDMFGGCFDANSGPQIPSSSSFRTFGLTSDKGEGGPFGVNKNYEIQNNMFRPGRIQPIEYSFMGEQSSNSLPGQSKIFPYNTNMEQGLDPSFWLGKNALTLNASHTSQVTSVCVWCRGIFFNEQLQAGIQTGAIGTMCPACSSKIPGQFNLL